MELPTAFWLLAGLAVAAEARPFTPAGRRPTWPVLPSVGLCFAVLLAWGLIPALATQAVAVAVAAVRTRQPPAGAAVSLGQYLAAFAGAELVLRLAALRPYPADGRLGLGATVAVVLAAAVWLLIRHALAAAALRARLGGRWWLRFRRSLARDALTHGALLALSPLLLLGAATSLALLPLAVLPLYAVLRMARLATDQAEATYRDRLTGLASRAALLRALADEVAAHTDGGGRRHRWRPALLLLDLDRFQHVNDALGHEYGDRLLVAVARRLTGVATGTELVARLGGDEFAVLARQISGTADATAVAHRFSAALTEPVRLDGLALEVGGAIGVAVFPEHGEEATALLRHADVAMYDAKQRAVPVAVYTAESDHHSPQRLRLLADVREALGTPDADGLELHYQPQVAISTGEVVAVEALLRWRHPVRGVISPDYLVRTAEHTAVMRLLTCRIVEQVVEQVAKWAAAGLTLRASVNVSVRDLQSGEVAERLAGALERYGVSADRIQLEITEGALMADPRRVLATIAALDRLGVAISLDDFGTGYSSLQHLRRLPLAEVKVDRSFVLGMSAGGGDAAIVRSIVELAGSLGLRVVAEGVEDERTWRMLAAAGCEVAQGWFFARPMPAGDLVTWLARYRPLAAPPGVVGRASAGLAGPGLAG